jgi:biopolymer transport protein ExbD
MSRFRRSRSQDEKEFNEINITPLTDVVLVLLLIFMITSPILMTGMLKIKLPESAHAETQPQENQNIVVSLTDKNELAVNGQAIKREELGALLHKELAAAPNAIVILDADKHALHGNVVDILDILKRAGAQKLAIGTMQN